MFDVTVLNPAYHEVDFPIYNFYASTLGHNVSVTLTEDGDTNARFNNLNEAIKHYNGLTHDVEYTIRDDSNITPNNKPYAFVRDTKVKSIHNTEERVIASPSKDELTGILRTIQTILERSDVTGFEQSDVDSVISLLRRTGVTSLSDLDNIFNIEPVDTLEDFFSVGRFANYSFDVINELKTTVPELSDYINFDNISTVSQDQLDIAIRSIPNLAERLGFVSSSTTTYAANTVSKDLGSWLKSTPAFKQLEDITDSKGKKLFPKGIETSSALHSNVTMLPDVFSVSVRADPKKAELERLLTQGRLVHNPLENLIRLAADATVATLSEVSAISGKSTKLTELVNILNGKDGISMSAALDLLKQHTNNLTNITPPKSEPLSLNTANDIQYFLDNPSSGLETPVNGGKVVSGLYDAAKAHVVTLASTVDTDFDGMDIKSGFSKMTPTSVMGSVISHQYIMLLQEMVAVLEETRNYSTTPSTMRRGANMMEYRASLLQPYVRAGSDKHTRYQDAAKAAQDYYIQRSTLNNAALTEHDKEIHVLAVAEWAADIMEFYKDAIVNVLRSEIHGYRSALISTKKSNIIDKTRSSAIMMNVMLTPEANAVLADDQIDTTDVVRVTVPDTRVPSDFVEGFNLIDFVDNDIDSSGRRLRNYDRDYLGETVNLTNMDIFNNLYNITASVLKPLKDAGYSFKIIRGLRKFDLSGRTPANQNNTDHHYGLAVDIQMDDPNLTGLAARFIKDHLPWNKLIVYNFNEGSLVNDGAFIHISHYWKPNHGWEKNWDKYPPGNGYFAQIGGNGIPLV